MVEMLATNMVLVLRLVLLVGGVAGVTIVGSGDNGRDGGGVVMVALPSRIPHLFFFVVCKNT